MKLALLLSLLSSLLVALPAGAADAAKAAQGKQVFTYWCQQCHGPGMDKPGTVALGAKYKGKLPAELEKRRDLQPALVKHFVRTGVSIMPFFRKTEISDADLDALAAYLAPRRR
jgi:mono/diheme cytochrome c family protein